MNASVVTLILGLCCASLFTWGIIALPRERWQIIAAIPLEQVKGGVWRGVNLTWYGALSATAYTVAVAVLAALMGAIGITVIQSATLTIGMLAVCVPASSLIALAVEKRRYTFTVGGAVFAGLLFSYPLIVAINAMTFPFFSDDIPLLPTLAALAVAYAFGEGLGRLACISFGCCYGKPLDRCAPFVRRLFRGWTITFRGATRKAVYAGDLEGTPLLPIQAVTSVIYLITALAGFYLFLSLHFGAAALLTLTVTQGWRVVSEQFRADYRGKGTFSAYQIMGVIGLAWASLMVFLTPAQTSLTADIGAGLTALWSPGVVLALQGLWLAIFLHTGLSSVTGARLSFHVHPDRIR